LGTECFLREITQVASPYGLPLQTIRRASAGATGANAATNSITYLSGLVSPDQEAEDYPTAITDEGGRTRNLEYNSSGQLRRATDLSGTVWWTNQYDVTSGALTQIINPLGSNHLKFTYDALDNVQALIFADGGALTNFYDSANRLNGVRLPSGTLMTNVFDSAGRLTNRQARVNGTVTENVGLDYNANDAVTIMIDNTGGTTNVFGAAGRLIGIDYPTGASVRYAHDLLGRVTSITNKASGGGSNFVTRYVYDLLG
jgi:YD repeat-containing protein